MEKTKLKALYDDNLNLFQRHLYEKTIYGLKAFPDHQVEEMCPRKKKEIEEIHQSAEYVLNKWKQQMTNRLTNRILEKLFPKSEITKLFTRKHRKTVDPKFNMLFELKDYGVTKKQVIDKLIEKQLLPKDFYELKGKR